MARTPHTPGPSTRSVLPHVIYATVLPRRLTITFQLPPGGDLAELQRQTPDGFELVPDPHHPGTLLFRATDARHNADQLIGALRATIGDRWTVSVLGGQH